MIKNYNPDKIIVFGSSATNTTENFLRRIDRVLECISGDVKIVRSKLSSKMTINN